MSTLTSSLMDTIYTQLLAQVMHECDRFHASYPTKNPHFSDQRDPSFVIPASSNANASFLPIFSLFQTYSPRKKKTRVSETVFASIQSVFQSLQKKPLSLTDLSYLNDAIFTRLSFSPEKTVPLFKKRALPNATFSSLKLALPHLDALLRPSCFPIGVRSTGLLNVTKLLRRRLLHVQKKSTLTSFHSFFFSASTFASQLGSSCLDTPSSLTDAELDQWVEFLSHLMAFQKYLAHCFLSVQLYVIHGTLVAHHALSTKPSSTASQLQETLSSQMSSTMQASFGQSGLLKDLVSASTSLSSYFSSCLSTLRSRKTIVSPHYFSKRDLFQSHSTSLLSNADQLLFSYLNTVFDHRQKWKKVGLHLFCVFGSELPVRQCIPFLATHIAQLCQSLSSLTKAFPESVQSQTALNYRICSTGLEAATTICRHLSASLYWFSLGAFQSMAQGHFSVFPDFLFALEKKSISASPFFFSFLSIAMTRSSFHSMTLTCIQSDPSLFLQLCQRSIVELLPKPTSDQLSLESRSDWWNSLFFKQKWMQQLRITLFELPSEQWSYLYPHFSLSALPNSLLIREWIRYGFTHAPEKKRLQHFVYFLQQSSANDRHLYSVFILLQKQQQSMPELHKFELSHHVLLDSFSSHFSLLKHLISSSETKPFVFINRLIETILDDGCRIEQHHCSFIARHVVDTFSDDFFFCFRLCLHDELPVFSRYAKWLLNHCVSSDQLRLLFNDFVQDMSSLTASQEASLLQLEKHCPTVIRPLVSALSCSNTDLFSQIAPYELELSCLLDQLSACLNNCLRSPSDPSSVVSSVSLFPVVQSLLTRVETPVYVYMDAQLANSCALLKHHACLHNYVAFNTLYGQLLSLFYTASMPLTHRYLLGYWVCLCSYLFRDTPSHSFYVPFSILAPLSTDASTFSASHFLSVLHSLSNEYDSQSLFSSDIQSLSHLTELWSLYVNSSVNFMLVEEIAPLYLSLLLRLSDDASYMSVSKQDLCRSLDVFFDFILTLPSAVFSQFLLDSLPELSRLITAGLFSASHPMISACIETFSQEESLTDDQQQLLDQMYSLASFNRALSAPSLNFDSLASSLDAPWLAAYSQHLFLHSPGTALSLSYQSLLALSHPSDISSEASITALLNTLFPFSLSSDQWAKNSLFNSLLALFYTDSKTSPDLRFLSVSDTESLSFLKFFLFSPDQSSTLLSLLSSVVQTSPNQKPLFRHFLLSLQQRLLQENMPVPWQIQSGCLLQLNQLLLSLEDPVTVVLNDCEQFISATIGSVSRLDQLSTFVGQISQYLHSISSQPALLLHDDDSRGPLDALVLVLLHFHSLSDETSFDSDTIMSCIKSLISLYCRLLMCQPCSDRVSPSVFETCLMQFQPLFLEAFSQYFSEKPSLSSRDFIAFFRFLSFIPKSLQSHLAADWFTALALFDRLPETQVSYIFSEGLSVLEPDVFVDIVFASSDFNTVITLLFSESPSLSCLFLSQENPDYSVSINAAISQLALSEHRSFSLIQPILGSDKSSSAFFQASTCAQMMGFLETQLRHSSEDFLIYVDCLSFINPDLFWSCCSYTDVSLCSFIIQALSRVPASYCCPFAKNWFLSDIFQFYLDDWIHLDLPLLELQFPPLLDAVISRSCSNATHLSADQLIIWLSYCYYHHDDARCFSFLKQRSYYSADCLVLLFFLKKKSLPVSVPSLFLCDYLRFLSSTELVECLSHIEQSYDISMDTLLTLIYESMDLDNLTYYQSLLFALFPLLSSSEKPYSESSLNSLFSLSALSSSNCLTLEQLLSHFVACQFIPHSLCPLHVTVFCDALLDTSSHVLILEFSLHHPDLFQQLLLLKRVASTLQHLVFYKEFTVNHSLYSPVHSAIQSMPRSYSLSFLYFYAASLLTESKQASLHTLLEPFYDPSLIITDHVLTHFKQDYLSLINTPLLRIPIDDLMVNTVFDSFLQVPETAESPNHFLFYCLNPKSISSVDSFEFLWVKKHCELLYQDKRNRLLLIHLLAHPDPKVSLQLFVSLIQFWETGQSLYELLSLYSVHSFEQQFLHNYCRHIVTIVTSFSFKSFEEKSFKNVLSAFHFLLYLGCDKPLLLQWFQSECIPKLNVQYIPLLRPLFSCPHINTSDFLSFGTAALKQGVFPIAFFLLSLCYKHAVFIPLWKSWVIHSKRHLLISDLSNEQSELYCLFKNALSYQLQHYPDRCFELCQFHYDQDLYIDAFFCSLYQDFFQKHPVMEMSISNLSKNPFIVCCRQALYAQNYGFLFFLGRCMEKFIIPYKLSSSWLLLLIMDLYRLDYQLLPHDDIRLFKSCVSSGLVSADGEFLHDLSHLSLDDIQTLGQWDMADLDVSSFLIRLKTLAQDRFKQRQFALSVFARSAPSLLVLSSPTISGVYTESPHHIFTHCPSLLDILLTQFMSTQKLSVLFDDCLQLLPHFSGTKSAFYLVIKALDTGHLYRLLTHPQLDATRRHNLLFSLLHDEKGRTHNVHLSNWKHLVIETLLTDLTDYWHCNTSPKSLTAHCDILVFFFIHFTDDFHVFCTPLYPTIAARTGICFPRILTCLTEFSLAPASFASFSSFMSFIASLYQNGFSLFECFIAFKASSHFSVDLERQWIDSFSKHQVPSPFNTSHHWFFPIYQQLQRIPELLYVPDSFFQLSDTHLLLKKWFQDQGILDSFNCLNCTSYATFCSVYSDHDVYIQLMTQLQSPLSLKPSSAELKDRARQFFVSFFDAITPEISSDPFYKTQSRLLLEMWGYVIPKKDSAACLAALSAFGDHLHRYELSQLLTPDFSSFMLPITLSTSYSHINSDYLDYFISTCPSVVDFSHEFFHAFSEQVTQEFRSFLVSHKCLDPRSNTVFQRQIDRIRTKITLSHAFHDCFQQLDRYLISKKSVLRDCFVVFARLYCILHTNTALKIDHCLHLFSVIEDHEWLFIKHILTKDIPPVSLKESLFSVLNNIHPPITINPSFTREACFVFARALKEISATFPAQGTAINAGGPSLLSTKESSPNLVQMLDDISQNF